MTGRSLARFRFKTRSRVCRFKLGRFVRLGPSIQLLHNREDDLEIVLGFRLKASDDFARHISKRQ
jgi:hypothetical protein